MAARRIVQSSINWTAIAERVPSSQKSSFAAFKSKSDLYLRRMMANPEKAPVIDWADYQKHIPVAGMVDTFKKNYEALAIPYPPDNVTNQIVEQEKQVKGEIADFKKQSQTRINEYQGKINYLNSLIPFEQMTMEDFKDSYPDVAIDSAKNPTFWPHDEDEQKDYRDKGHPLYGADPHTAH